MGTVFINSPYFFTISILNDSLGTLSFAQDSNGKWGYKVGASTEIIPFKSAELKTMTFTETSKTVEFDEPPVIVLCYSNTNSAISGYYDTINKLAGGYGVAITKNSDTNYTFMDNISGGTRTILYV